MILNDEVKLFEEGVGTIKKGECSITSQRDRFAEFLTTHIDLLLNVVTHDRLVFSLSFSFALVAGLGEDLDRLRVRPMNLMTDSFHMATGYALVPRQ